MGQKYESNNGCPQTGQTQSLWQKEGVCERWSGRVGVNGTEENKIRYLLENLNFWVSLKDYQTGFPHIQSVAQEWLQRREWVKPKSSCTESARRRSGKSCKRLGLSSVENLTSLLVSSISAVSIRSLVLHSVVVNLHVFAFFDIFLRLHWTKLTKHWKSYLYEIKIFFFFKSVLGLFFFINNGAI